MTTSNSVEAREVTVNGRALRCQVCDFPRFFKREAELTTGSSFFGQDWTNSKADCLVCEQCGYVHWFVKTRPVVRSAEETSLSVEIEDLRRRLEAEYEASLETSNA